MKKNCIAIIAVLALSALGSCAKTDDPASPPGPASTPVATSSVSEPSGTPTTDPSVQASLDKAAADQAKADTAAAAAKKKAEEEAARAAAAAAARAEAAKRNPASYAKISARTFAKVAKNPDSYIGKKYVLYGYVTQFDSATGTTTFRANLDGKKYGDWYLYETNSIVDEGIPGIFDDVVQDDLVTLHVEVQGSYSYDTQIGGNTTVPRFTANIIKVTGSSK